LINDTKTIRHKFYQLMEYSPIYTIIITLYWECTRKEEKYNCTLNNSGFVDCVDRIYHIELEIKDTTDTYMSASYLDLYLSLEIDSEGWLKTKLYDKRDDFNFPIVNFYLYWATFQQHMYMECISLSWFQSLWFLSGNQNLMFDSLSSRSVLDTTSCDKKNLIILKG
jgi:hypothetical protein